MNDLPGLLYIVAIAAIACVAILWDAIKRSPDRLPKVLVNRRTGKFSRRFDDFTTCPRCLEEVESNPSVHAKRFWHGDCLEEHERSRVN